jgi:hypothetical protein
MRGGFLIFCISRPLSVDLGAGYVNPPESFKTYWHLRNQSVVLRALSQYAILALSGRKGGECQ